MITKMHAKRGVRVLVTFTLTAPGARSVEVTGQFSDWQPVPMRRTRNGAWDITIELEPARALEFKYLIDKVEWVNDPAADLYVPNPFGEENSVVLT